MMKASGTQIRSVARAAAVLELVARQPGLSRATDVAAALGVPLPTAYHLLNTLVGEGFLTKLDNRRYELGPKVGLLAEAFAAQVSAPQHLVERLSELADRTGDTAYLSAWRRGEAVVLAIIEGRRAVRVSGLHLGYSGAAHTRASGKVMLAFGPPGILEEYLREHDVEVRTGRASRGADALRAEIERTRRAGYGVDEEEFTEGVACVAAPVADGSMAITVSTPIERYRERRGELVRAVTEVAAQAIAPQLAAAAR